MSMAGYTKLFNSILASTIWRANDKTRIVWITLLAMADKDGICEGSVPGLADLSRVSIEDCEMALEELSSPDPYSRTSDHEGRRIEHIDGVGWRLLNHAKYRSKMSEDERREYNRIKQAEWRAKQKEDVNDSQDASMTVNDNQSLSAMSAHTEADTDTKAEKKKNKKAVADAPDGDLKKSSRPKKPSSPKDERSARPIILAVKELMNRYPDKLLWDKLIARFGDDFDSAKLRECRESWLERGYNANATTWLNWYFDGIPTRQTPKPETQSYNYVRNQPTQREAIEAEQRMIAEMREQ